jgi:2,3,4,5-tetrahydropyridine-2-carboxylate N-succinyltransferase
MILRDHIEQFFAEGDHISDRTAAQQAFNELRFFLNNGELRAASPGTGPNSCAGWAVNEWVKKGILLGFRIGDLADFSVNEHVRFFDRHVLPLRKLTLEHQVRVVPGGTAIRDGAHLGRNVVVMPPSYINIGAYVDEGTMIDSHALVGSCAQVGKRVHLSAGASLGGVLEPIQALPVIVEDDVFIGGNTGIFEGTIIKRRAVIAAGVILTRSTPVYDLANVRVIRATPQMPLVIPEGAVVIPGSRPLAQPFAKEHGLSVSTPIIVKYRDDRTDAATVLEESLR